MPQSERWTLIAGEQFTLADVGMVVIFDRIEEADWQELLMTEDLQLVKAYAECLKQRPSYASALDGHRLSTVSAGRDLTSITDRATISQ